MKAKDVRGFQHISINTIINALGLLNSMIEGGEQHSQISREQLQAAYKELDKLSGNQEITLNRDKVAKILYDNWMFQKQDPLQPKWEDLPESWRWTWEHLADVILAALPDLLESKNE